MEERIDLLPFGDVETWVLDHLAAGLRETFRAAVLTREARPLPAETFNARRDQYNSSLILTRMDREVSLSSNGPVLGVTEVDLYTPRLNFVFGEAQLSGRFAVISLARLHANPEAGPEGRSLFLRRALTEAVHELGHVAGVGHCPDPACVMHFSTNLADTDRKSSEFCPRCSGKLRRAAARV